MPFFHCQSEQLAAVPQSNQEPLVVTNQVRKPPSELGVSKSMECDSFPLSTLTLLVGQQERYPACKRLGVGLLVAPIWMLQFGVEWWLSGTTLLKLSWIIVVKWVSGCRCSLLLIVLLFFLSVMFYIFQQCCYCPTCIVFMSVFASSNQIKITFITFWQPWGWISNTLTLDTHYTVLQNTKYKICT